MARVYATAEQYETYTGAAAPADIDYRLARASSIPRRAGPSCLLVHGRRQRPPNGRRCRCRVRGGHVRAAQWGVEVGDITGAFMAGFGNASIGSGALGRSVTAVSGADAPGRQVAPAVWDALGSPDLTPDLFRMGMVTS
jgi:hypothetical protein